MKYSGIVAAGLLGSAMALPAQQPAVDQNTPGLPKGANWDSPSEPGASAGERTISIVPGASHIPDSSPAGPTDSHSEGGLVHRITEKALSLFITELKKVDHDMLSSAEPGVPSSTRWPSPYGSTGLPSTPGVAITPAVSAWTGRPKDKPEYNGRQNGGFEGAHRETGPKEKREENAECGPSGNCDYFPQGGFESTAGQSEAPPATATEAVLEAAADAVNAVNAAGIFQATSAPKPSAVPSPRGSSSSSVPRSTSTVVVTVTPTPTPTPSPSQPSVDDITEQSVSEDEASQSSADEAASYSASLAYYYSTSQAGWDIMHPFKRRADTLEHEDGNMGEGNGPASSSATPTPEPSTPVPSDEPSNNAPSHSAPPIPTGPGSSAIPGDTHGGSPNGHGSGPDGGPHGGDASGHGSGPHGGPHGGPGGSGGAPGGGQGGNKPTPARSTVSPSSSPSFTPSSLPSSSPSSTVIPILDHQAPGSGGERRPAAPVLQQEAPGSGRSGGQQRRPGILPI